MSDAPASLMITRSEISTAGLTATFSSIIRTQVTKMHYLFALLVTVKSNILLLPRYLRKKVMRYITSSVIFVNENENVEKRENNKFVNETKTRK